MDSDEEDNSYVHAEHFKFLEGTFGTFGSGCVTNLDASQISIGVADNDIDSSTAMTSDDGMNMAADDLEAQVEKDVKQELAKAKRMRKADENYDDDEVMITKTTKAMSTNADVAGDYLLLRLFDRLRPFLGRRSNTYAFLSGARRLNLNNRPTFIMLCYII